MVDADAEGVPRRGGAAAMVTGHDRVTISAMKVVLGMAGTRSVEANQDNILYSNLGRREHEMPGGFCYYAMWPMITKNLAKKP